MIARVLSGPLTAAGVAVLALALWGSRLPDLDVRTAPRRTTIGHLRAGSAAGESFAVERDGLHRIDVAVAVFTEQSPDEVELVLRADGPQGEELRRARARELLPDPQGGWLRFEFEPVPDSAGRRYHAQIQPAQGAEVCWYVPWARMRGMADLGAAWGREVFPGPLVEGSFISLNPSLRGLAFGGEELQGRSTLVLLDAQGRELRRAEVDLAERTEWGWLMFGFEPVPDSRWKTYRFRLELPDQTRLQGSAEGPARVGFYGSGRVDARLGGMTQGSRAFGDRDLCLRAWTENGAGLALARLRERLGWRLGPLLLAWLLASWLLPAALAAGARGGSGAG